MAWMMMMLEYIFIAFYFFYRMNNFIFSLFLMTSFYFNMVVRIILMLSCLDNIPFGFVWLGMLDNHVMFMHLLYCFVYFVPYLDMLRNQNVDVLQYSWVGFGLLFYIPCLSWYLVFAIDIFWHIFVCNYFD